MERREKHYFKELNIDNIKFVINNTNIEKSFEKLAYELLSKETEVPTLQEFADFVNSNEKAAEQKMSLFE